MQPFIDGVLSDAEVHEAEAHLERCRWCAKRYRFEERLRHYVRVAVSEPMSSGAEGEARGAAHVAPVAPGDEDVDEVAEVVDAFAASGLAGVGADLLFAVRLEERSGPAAR